jgi:hypothetical protein
MPEQPGDVPLTYADITKVRAQLGYNPRTQIAEGIPKFVEWFRGYEVRRLELSWTLRENARQPRWRAALSMNDDRTALRH